MNYRIRSALATVALLLAAGSSWAHHSQAAVFDFSKKFTLVGTLARVDWRNPHIQAFLESKGDGGKMEAWVMEAMAPSSFRTRGVSKSDFEKFVGQTVTVEAVRARDGSLYGLLLKITFPDGRVVVTGYT